MEENKVSGDKTKYLTIFYMRCTTHAQMWTIIFFSKKKPTKVIHGC